MNKELSGFEFLSSLCDVFAPSGGERPATELIKEQISSYCDDVWYDKKGNLICRISPEKESSENVLFCAAADERSFMVTDIDGDGRLRVDALGGGRTDLISGRKVTVGRGDKTTVGIFSSKPVHLQSGDEEKKPTPLDKMYIELGTGSKEETEKLVKRGDLCTFRSKSEDFGDGLFKGKALEYRVGCAVLCELIRSVDRSRISENLYFAFTVLGALGKRASGASVAANVISPVRAYVFDGLNSGDVYGAKEHEMNCRLGDGVVISAADVWTVYSPTLTAEYAEKLRAAGIKTQLNRTNGGNDISAEIQRSGTGTSVVSVRIPVRYAGTPSSLISKSDYENMTAAAKACLSGGMKK